MLFSYSRAKHPELVDASIKWPFIGMLLWLPMAFVGFVLIQYFPDELSRKVIIIAVGVLCMAVFMVCFNRGMNLIDRAYEE